MKKLYAILLAFATCIAMAQQKEKIKGSKNVTIASKTLTDFENVEIGDALEITIVKGISPSLDIEADDNLHEIIIAEINGKTLKLGLKKDISSSKKCLIRLNYTASLKQILVKNEANVTANARIELPEIYIKAIDESKLNLNIDCKNVTLNLSDKSETELHSKSENMTIEASKSAELKGNLVSQNLKFDLYQKAEANVEGEISDFILRLDADTNLKAKKLLVKNTNILAEGDSKASIQTANQLTIEVTGSSEIEIYGDPKIDLKRFADNAKLIKKTTK
ncbi:hypothetical protein B0A58_12560 [Flavobacterium branchiophilum NBRC 15030 = ATCC 35035]|uniref:Putative autotransporter adhesin-like protein n=1 Tax=Flavobacterium branchiophilum TaxID=55197 RepID=A0A543G7U7_9FLAO|nr:DUF2807 domain-containing protein [Flavobacterium branchiophilum]OXA72642.1 hypothetical protein B0A58_12560 [Flavobacterium branchiophilum NBRC 15030 = ATCC 35035]TQM42153.1 putative autotransporter adhesin-like protein [Flavobacterium branchiophilum]GEM53925.1 hypothetical protein FB1_01460 [Flavobacterium branchiophilum NBRC 15030 = ATCC 35035]